MKLDGNTQAITFLARWPSAITYPNHYKSSKTTLDGTWLTHYQAITALARWVTAIARWAVARKLHGEVVVVVFYYYGPLKIAT